MKNCKLLLLTAGFILSVQCALQAKNSISNVTFTPASPAYMLTAESPDDGDKVEITFDYTADLIKGGVRIWLLPYTKGNPSPNYGVSGSPLYTALSGSGDGYVRIRSGNVTVDQIQIRMTPDSDYTTTLVEQFYNVRYYYGTNIYNVNLTPSSPDTLAPGDKIDITFDYALSEESDEYNIFALPLTNGSISQSTAYLASPPYTFGKGSSSTWFLINAPNVLVDQVRFQIKRRVTNELIYEKFINVHYRFCNGNCIWHVKPNTSGSQTGQSWPYAFHDLQDALAVAEAGDQIWVAQGTYYPDEDFDNPDGDNDLTKSFVLKDGVGIYGGFTGTETSIDQRDWLGNPTVLSGAIGASTSTDNSLHVVRSENNSSSAVLDGFTITQGHAKGNYPEYIGGGALIRNSSPTFQNCSFKYNQAGSGGGAGTWSGGEPSFLNCQFIENSATGAGGAVNIQTSGPIFRVCTFLGNSSENGGAVWSINNLTRPVFQSCLFNFNTASGSGGALYTSATEGTNENAPQVENCTIVNNTASYNCGGIYNSGGASIPVNSSILWGNTDAGGSDQDAQYYASHIPQVEYSCIQNYTGGFSGIGNIDDFPLFVYPEGLDNIVGTEDDNYYLLPGSPCIDTGDPAPIMNDPDGSRNDMGAYGGPWSGLSGGVGVIPGSGYVFTTIGNLPTAFITQSSANASYLQGTANVTSSQATDYQIPQYQNSPFGSKIWLHGLFGADDNVTHYKIQAGKWNGDTPPSSGSFFDITDSLYKIYYFYNIITHEWVPVSTKVGPNTVEGVSNLYTYTSTGFWSHLDLRMIWNTRAVADGKYTLRIKGYHQETGSMSDVTPANAQELIVLVENSPLTCEIEAVKYDSSSPYWTVGDDGEIQECAIINLGSVRENLRFKINASHPDGFLRQFTLDAIAGKNDHRGTIKTMTYNFADGPLWPGVTGMEFGSDVPTFQDWKRCAYQFRLRTWSRVNNGYYYIYYREFNDHYFIDLGDSGCTAADVNSDGIVNLGDIYQISLHWMEECNSN